jgi:hypothetical protein
MNHHMTDYTQEVREVYEELVGHRLTELEVSDIVLSLRQFIAFLVECGQDEDLRSKLGMPALVQGMGKSTQTSADPRAANNTTRAVRKPRRERLRTRPDAPTGASSHDISHRRVSSANRTDATAPEPVPTPLNAGATINGS